MKTVKRMLKIDLPPRQSTFLWGPRKTGKSFFLKQTFPHSLVFDFLKTDLFLEYLQTPSLFREQLLAKNPDELKHPIILDEVQKVPKILDEIHWLIENSEMQFILCGSSARKLKRGQANLLGGRAWRYEMFPFVWPELDQPDLLQVLNQGLVPDHHLSPQYRKALRAYTQDYLKEEVFNEGLTRNIPAFSRFFDAMGYSHGELINYSNIARDCGVDAKTVKEYYQILVDTLIGTLIEPFKKRQNRQVITRAPKFYLFDVGVAGAITNRHLDQPRGELFGKAFEHYLFMELNAHRSYTELDYKINFWRTKSGLEVDFVLGNGQIAIEVKGTSAIRPSDLKPMKAFVEEYHPQKAIIVCNEKQARLHDGIYIMPYTEFLERLWQGEIIG